MSRLYSFVLYVLNVDTYVHKVVSSMLSDVTNLLKELQCTLLK